jgi:hypothetical protein
MAYLRDERGVERGGATADMEQDKRSKRANLVHSLQKWKSPLPHQHHQAYKIAWYNTSIAFFLG